MHFPSVVKSAFFLEYTINEARPLQETLRIGKVKDGEELCGENSAALDLHR